LATDLLAQFEQFGGRQPAPCGGLFATNFLALRRPMGSDCIPDFVAANLANPQEITGHRQRWAAGENEQAWEG
jgi:hypothetical protein